MSTGALDSQRAARYAARKRVNDIAIALMQLYSSEFQVRLSRASNPYEQENSTAKVVEILKKHPIAGIIKKSFYDISSNPGAGGAE